MLGERVLSWWRRRRRPPAAGEPGTLFAARYHSLRLLLAANNRALELMSELERAAGGGGEPFGMAFVRSRCTALSVAVYQMVRHLDELAPGRYRDLFTRVRGMQEHIRAALELPGPDTEGQRLTLPLDEIDGRAAGAVGTKMANLGQARSALGLETPPGFAITARAFRLLLEHNQLSADLASLIQSSEQERSDELFALSSRLQQLIIAADVPPALADEVARRQAELAASSESVAPRLAVRSSALGEDSVHASFAGQYRSELNVRPEHLLTAYLEVAASTYTPQAMHYRLQRGLRDEDALMAVGCLAMVDARCGGVVYTSNPADPSDRRVFVSAVWGLPRAVVDGSAPSDLLVLARDGEHAVLERRIVAKPTALACDPGEGVVRRPVPEELAEGPSLNDDNARRVAAMALTLEAHFGCPQDVEWAFTEDDRLLLLQCRPLRRGAAAEEIAEAVAPGTALLRGEVCASPGTAAGPVHLLRRDSDALAFPDGGVLVLEHPLPRWAALLGRAAAVIAGEGAMAGHLATVAREFGVPALFGVEGLDRLRQGMEVTVDAAGRAVYEGCIPGLLAASSPRSPHLIGTPVHTALTGALSHIAPLRLLDPDGPDFRPQHCRTLHDVTRFCHEQAVREMFSFARRHPFPRHASKQLFHEVPMQWWVLDLDDGFAHEVPGPYVHLDDITSRPMLALWEGMTAIPWEGPPAMTGGGFASVLFEATANPALATPFRSPYAQRNYFMISSRFMNLQSRFGFHFSTVEALVGERDPENYLSFSFKGGAADLERRRARVDLLADVLEGQGFSVKVIEDAATARISAMSAEAMESRLRVVGYLVMHTRQLDMVMADPAAVRRYRDKLLADIHRVA